MKPIHTTQRARRGKIFSGITLLLVGSFFLLKQLGYTYLPSWNTFWPLLLILMGLFNGLRHNFRHPAWFILMSIGGVFLYDSLMLGVNISQFIWPVLIILLGLWMIFGPKRHRPDNWCNEDQGYNQNDNQEPVIPSQPFTANPAADNSSSWNIASAPPINRNSDYIDSVAVFGGVKKNIVSKNFQGGDIVTFMGGTEINLTQADIQGKVILEVTQVMGGTRLMIPPHWDVVFEVTAVLGGVEDKRMIQAGVINPDKVLIIKGTCVLSGIDVRSF